MPTPRIKEPIVGDDVTPWEQTRTALATAGSYWLATVSPDGRPHIRPVLAVWVDDTLHFSSGASTRKARHLATTPRCVVTTGASGVDIVVEGEAVRVDDEARLTRVAQAYRSEYEWPVEVQDGALQVDEGAPTAGPPPYDVYEVRAETVLAFATDTTFSPTRYRF